MDERERFIKNNPPRNGVAKVPLGKDLFALVDVDDYQRVIQHSWSLNATRGGLMYAKSSIRSERGDYEKVFLHRFIMGCSIGDGKEVDHRSGEGLDCRKANLRFATRQQNMANQAARSRCGYKGVTFNGSRNKPWIAGITVDGKRHRLGRFDNAENAALAYNVAARLFHGEFAWLNDV